MPLNSASAGLAGSCIAQTSSTTVEHDLGKKGLMLLVKVGVAVQRIVPQIAILGFLFEHRLQCFCE